jgi:hypothetical protein
MAHSREVARDLRVISDVASGAVSALNTLKSDFDNLQSSLSH